MIGLDLDANSSLQLEESFWILKSMRKHEAMQVVKTWANAWATSSRYHENPVLPCIFGCPPSPGSDDRLSHYIACPIMWSLAQDAIGTELPNTSLSRVGVCNPSVHTFNVIAALFQAYHNSRTFISEHNNRSLCDNLFLGSVRRHFREAFLIAFRGMPGYVNKTLSQNSLSPSCTLSLIHDTHHELPEFSDTYDRDFPFIPDPIVADGSERPL